MTTRSRGRAPTVTVAGALHRDTTPAVPTDDTLAVEAPLELVVGGETLAVLLRTPTGPDDDVALALGFLLAEGIIDDARDVLAAAPCADPAAAAPENRVVVTLADGVPAPSSRRRFVSGSSCGLCGVDALAGLLDDLPPRPPDALALAARDLHGGPDGLAARVRPHQPLFVATGGVHAAALFRGDALLDVREDIGRHNAVDKLIGRRLRAGHMPAFDTFIWVSGRASFELVQKALRAGVGGLVAVGAPSALAVEVARAHGLVLAGFARDDRATVYSGRVAS